MLFQNKEERHTENWQHCVNYDTDVETNCEEGGCDSICRCSVITGISVPANLYGINYFFDQTYVNTGDGLDKVLAHWFLRKHFELITWGYQSTGGYYGEEMKAVTIESDGGFFNLAEGFEAMSYKDKIEYLLDREYGSILPDIAAVKDWQLKTVFLSDITQSLNKKLSPVYLKSYEEHCQNLVRHLGKDTSSFQADTQVLAPLCLGGSGKYQIIDGRHRITALSKEYKWDAYMSVPTTGKRNQTKKVEKSFAPLYTWIICPKEV